MENIPKEMLIYYYQYILKQYTVVTLAFLLWCFVKIDTGIMQTQLDALRGCQCYFPATHPINNLLSQMWLAVLFFILIALLLHWATWKLLMLKHEDDDEESF